MCESSLRMNKELAAFLMGRQLPALDGRTETMDSTELDLYLKALGKAVRIKQQQN